MNAKNVSLLLGAVFALVGVLGFVPNPLVGPEGFFLTDTLHNLVHLATGIAFLALAKTSMNVLFLKAFGVVYILVAALGFMLGGGAEEFHLLGLIHMNAIDNWLHLVLGVVILGLGLVFCKDCKKK